MFEPTTSPEVPAAHSPLRKDAPHIWRMALTAWCLSGMIAGLGFSLGVSLLRPGRVRDEPRSWREAVGRMDGRWYKQIAAEGYHYNPHARSSIAFFPVYPLAGAAGY